MLGAPLEPLHRARCCRFATFKPSLCVPKYKHGGRFDCSAVLVFEDRATASQAGLEHACTMVDEESVAERHTHRARPQIPAHSVRSAHHSSCGAACGGAGR